MRRRRRRGAVIALQRAMRLLSPTLNKTERVPPLRVVRPRRLPWTMMRGSGGGGGGGAVVAAAGGGGGGGATLRPSRMVTR